MTRDAAPRTVLLRDYRPPAFLIDTVELSLHLDPHATRVRARLQYRRNPKAGEANLQLQGELRHPADEYRDRILALRAVAPGIYEAKIVGDGKGWRDALIRTDAGTPFEMERRLWLP